MLIFEVGNREIPSGNVLIYVRVRETGLCIGYELDASSGKGVVGELKDVERMKKKAEEEGLDVINGLEVDDCIEAQYKLRELGYEYCMLYNDPDRQPDYSKLNEKEQIKYLDRLVETFEESGDEEVLEEIVRLSKFMSKYDVDGLIEVLKRGKIGRNLVNLYFAMFYSVCDEDYEYAKEFRDRIDSYNTYLRD